MTEWIQIVVATIVAIVTVWYFKAAHLKQLGKDVIATDSEFHVMLINAIRSNHHVPFRLRDDRFLVEPYYYYPPLLHWALSFVSPDRLQRYQAYVPILLKTGVVVLLGFMAGYLTSRTELAGSVLMPGVAALLAGLIYGFSPMNRCAYGWAMYDYQLSPRALGMLLTVLVETALIGHLLTGHTFFLIAGAVFVAATCLASKFALQTQTFLLVGLAIFEQSFVPLILWGAGIGLAVILSGGFFLTLAKVHLSHLYICVARISAQHAATQVTSALASLNVLRGIWYLTRFRFGQFFMLIQRDVVLRACAYYPIHVLAAVYLVMYWDWMLAEPLLKQLAVLWAISAVMWIATSFRLTKFLGEADRYMEFAGIFPATLLFVLLGFRDPVSLQLSVIGITCCMGWYFFLHVYEPRRTFAIDQHRESLDQFLATLDSENCTFVCIPNTHARRLATEFGFQVMQYVNLTGIQMYDEFFERFSVPHVEPECLRRYQVTHMMVHHDYLNDAYVQDAIQDYPEVFSTKFYRVLSVN